MSTGPVLGLFRDWDCATEERTLYKGDTLAIYTDGVTAFNEAGEESEKSASSTRCAGIGICLRKVPYQHWLMKSGGSARWSRATTSP